MFVGWAFGAVLPGWVSDRSVTSVNFKTAKFSVPSDLRKNYHGAEKNFEISNISNI